MVPVERWCEWIQQSPAAAAAGRICSMGKLLRTSIQLLSTALRAMRFEASDGLNASSPANQGTWTTNLRLEPGKSDATCCYALCAPVVLEPHPVRYFCIGETGIWPAANIDCIRARRPESRVRGSWDCFLM